MNFCHNSFLPHYHLHHREHKNSHKIPQEMQKICIKLQSVFCLSSSALNKFLKLHLPATRFGTAGETLEHPRRTAEATQGSSATSHSSTCAEFLDTREHSIKDSPICVFAALRRPSFRAQVQHAPCRGTQRELRWRETPVGTTGPRGNPGRWVAPPEPWHRKATPGTE